MTNKLNIASADLKRIESLTAAQLKLVRYNIQEREYSDEQTREALMEAVADGGDVADFLPTYDDIRGTGTREQVAEFLATWPNGNDPDGQTQCVIYAHGSIDQGGFVLEVDDNQNGGSPREAGETIYQTFEAAKAAASSYAEERDEA